MRALTNGEGKEEEVVASAGAAPGLGRKRRRAEQRSAQRARAAEARGAGRGGMSYWKVFSGRLLIIPIRAKHGFVRCIVPL